MAEHNQPDTDNIQPRTQFTGFRDLGEYVLKNLQNNAHKLKDYAMGQDYPWPGWDEKKLGKPPTIELPSLQEKADVAEFNKVLSNISKMASVEGADELRNQLTALSGVPINIKDLSGNLDQARAPLGTPRVGGESNFSGAKPEMSFNPHAWGRYPVEGSKGDHGIAPPEQMMIHELGHYAELYKVHQDYLAISQKNTDPNVAVHASEAGTTKALDERHIVADYENPAMASVDAGYKKRDAAAYTGGQILIADKKGYPAVDEQDRPTLIHAMKASGRAVPAELEGPHSRLDAIPGAVPNAREDKTLSQAVTNEIASKAALEQHFAQLAKDGRSPDEIAALRRLTHETIAEHAAKGTLPAVTVNVNVTAELTAHHTEQGRELV